MKPRRLMLIPVVIAMLGASRALAQGDQALVDQVLKTLNADESVRVSDVSKSYQLLFDAYLTLTDPPFPVGPDFNLNTIHPKMSTWSAVSGWAESNSKMAQAILASKNKAVFGLPYGRDGLSEAYLNKNLYADVGVDDNLRKTDFAYLRAIDTIAAFATAESYRLLESGQIQPGLDLAVAHLFVVRQVCDRKFLEENRHAIDQLASAISNLRDMFYVYRDKISADQFATLALEEIPYLRPDRSRLFMPEFDRVVSEALIKDLFDERTGMADPDKFTKTFAEIQSKDAPLTRFGAARRWAAIAPLHASRQDSLNRLQLIYDDWWRRWRIDAYDPILALDTQFERTNPIRYAAVVYSIRDVETAFSVRNQLIAEVNGTAVLAGVCAYERTFRTFPDTLEKTYTQFARKRSDVDPFDRQLRELRFRKVSERHAVDTPYGRIWVEPGNCLLYGQGQDHDDDLGGEHTNDGAFGDVVMWPPVKALAREQGLLE